MASRALDPSPPDAPAGAAAPQLLLIEDTAEDARLIESILADDGFDCRITRVATRPALEQALAKGGYDLIVSDYTLPGFDGLSALALAREHAPEVPFVFCTGTLGEERVVQCLQQGATDYVPKHNLPRLAPALRRALAEARQRQARLAAEQRVQHTERRLHNLVDSSPAVIYATTPFPPHVTTFVSNNLYAVMGYRPEEMIGRECFWLERLHPDDLARVTAEVERQLEQAAMGTVEYRFGDAGGRYRWLQDSFRMVFDEDGQPAEIVGSWADVTAAHALAEELSWHASHDTLTGLANRREFERQLAAALLDARGNGSVHSLCYMDLDQFKLVNDTCGHDAGDELLRRLARRLAAATRKGDLLCRLGGDEFALVMMHCTAAQAQRTAQSLLETVRQCRFDWQGRQWQIGVSIGIVAIAAGSGKAADVMRTADEACYLAKDQGRNRIHVHHEQDENLARRRREMHGVTMITEGLDEGRFVLYGQRISALSAAAGADACELLLRLPGRDGVLLPPGTLIPAAERYGLAGRLDRWVVERALATLAASPAALRRFGHFAINLSAPSIGDHEFAAFLIDALAAGPVPANRICFEITETAAIDNLLDAVRFMDMLRGIGCRFALDDFGSGMSSFRYLRHLPVDFLKIDGAFVTGIHEDEVALAMMRSINDIGHVMGKLTVAECAESTAVVEHLRASGVDFVQGHVTGRAVPLGELLADVAPARSRLTASGPVSRGA